MLLWHCPARLPFATIAALAFLAALLTRLPRKVNDGHEAFLSDRHRYRRHVHGYRDVRGGRAHGDAQGAIDAGRLQPRNRRARSRRALREAGGGAGSGHRRSSTRRPSPPTPSSNSRARAPALLTTAGFRDVLELRRLRIPVLYDLQYDKPTPLVAAAPRLEVRERMGPRRRGPRAARRATTSSRPRHRLPARERRGGRDQLSPRLRESGA